MRNFDDASGAHWQAALLDGSYGNTLLVFSRLDDDAVRQATLGTENLRLAEQQLLHMDESQLRSLLDQSQPWT